MFIILKVALVVAHTRDRKNRLSPILMAALSQAFVKLCHLAKQTDGKCIVY